MEKFLSGLYTYPIKSCRGNSLDKVFVGSKGPDWDRRWMVVDASGRFVSQRKHPRLALIAATVSKECLHVAFPDGKSFVLPIPSLTEDIEVEVWNDRCRAKIADKRINQAFSDYLAIECRLVFIPDDSIRSVSSDYAVSHNDQVSFADGFPFLVISEASLNHLNSLLPQPIGMDRFRPNLVISGCEPYEEDSWKRIKIGSLEFEIVKPCSRCVITTIDQTTGVKQLEPLQTLSRYRKQGKGIMFGQNAIHLMQGVIKVGDPVYC